MDKKNNSNKHHNNNITDINSKRKKTLTKDEKQAQKHVDRSKNKKGGNFYYSFLTIVLIICLIQVSFSAILNISKTVVYHNKIVKIKKIRNEAERRNKNLKNEIKEFSKTASLEAIARNNLKMAGEDEVLIIINDNDKDKKNDKIKKKKKGFFR